jgi:peptide/nickel transport system substrate-binding protein
MSRTVGYLSAAMLAGIAVSASAQSAQAEKSIVIVTGQQPTTPIPTLMEGAAASLGNTELADQLFLRLAGLGPTMLTAGDRGFIPLLARSWTRRDSVTLVFNLDPRAQWQDGVPVTSRDVVFSFQRAQNPAVAPRLATLLQHIIGVTAEGDRRVVFRFSHPYSEQLYDATFHVAPLPAHLLDTLPPDAIARSSFVTQPVGSGPYRLVRIVPGQFAELAANQKFFLGSPKITRVIIRFASDPDARLNLLLSGQADAMDNIIPPLDNLRRVSADSSLRLVPVPSPAVGFLLFNQRDPADTSRPHPILSDARVRRAITLALDRSSMVRVVFGTYGEVPYGPVSPVLWIRHGAPKPAQQNVAESRRLLLAAGWRDSDGDGTLDRGGQLLDLRLSLPNTSAIRRQLALLVQEQLRQVGIRVELSQMEFPLWIERRTAGNFDIDFGSTSQDPSPSGLSQGWTCSGGTNVGHYCNPRVDSLMERAVLTRDHPSEAWRQVLQQIEADAPATFLYAPTYVYAVRRRFRDVTISPASSWQHLWEWSVDR